MNRTVVSTVQQLVQSLLGVEFFSLGCFAAIQPKSRAGTIETIVLLSLGVAAQGFKKCFWIVAIHCAFNACRNTTAPFYRNL